MRQEGDAGFTLLEVLVALVVFGFLMLGLGRGVDFGMRAWDRQTRGIAARGELDAVDRALRGLIGRLDPTTDVAGRAHGVGFTSRLPAMATLATREADMALGVDGARRLMLRWTPHLHAQRFGPPPAPEEAELLRGIERLDLAYWPRSGSGWRDAWSGHEPPAMIRVRVMFPAGDARHWPDIVAAPMRDSAND